MTGTTTVTVTPIYLNGLPDSAFAGHGFEITAVKNGNSLSTFAQPVNTEIAYSDLDVSFVTDEDVLVLLWWNGSNWIDAANTCTPNTTYTRNTTNNTINIGVCKAGRYGLFGPTSRVFMPIFLNP